ncbi:hypothetical protein PAHAL_9G141800 [Panicum hallii]|uniref:Uncharacterized protein n=1 Tax=Panicum hallii TaxID=206008 RepID=A0A2T8I165_9POAL|nr:hypothetical protein PAHAL_9G141800 [Panicum hallii]
MRSNIKRYSERCNLRKGNVPNLPPNGQNTHRIEALGVLHQETPPTAGMAPRAKNPPQIAGSQ